MHQHVLKPFDRELGAGASTSTTLLGDWYVNLLNAGRFRWVLCVSERALLPVIVPARKATFPGSLSSSLRAVFSGLGIPSEEIEREIAEMAQMGFDRTRSRQVLGVMNDFAVAAELFLRDGIGPIEVASGAPALRRSTPARAQSRSATARSAGSGAAGRFGAPRVPR